MITRTYMAAALLTTAACALDIVSPFSLYYSWTMVWDRGQFWRVFTNFFFFGAKFSLEFLFHMFFLVQYCRSLEEGSFRGRTADFFWMILLGASALLVVAPFAHMTFLGNSLSFMMVYVWARRNPFVRMSFLGLFTFTAPYLPWVLLGFSFLLEHDGQNANGRALAAAADSSTTERLTGLPACRSTRFDRLRALFRAHRCRRLSRCVAVVVLCARPLLSALVCVSDGRFVGHRDWSHVLFPRRCVSAHDADQKEDPQDATNHVRERHMQRFRSKQREMHATNARFGVAVCACS